MILINIVEKTVEELNVHDRIKKSKLFMIDVFERQ